jgi:hypothetical protein
MKIEINAIRNGYTIALTNPNSIPEVFFVPTWDEIKKIITDQIEIGDKPPAPITIVPGVGQLPNDDDKSIV